MYSFFFNNMQFLYDFEAPIMHRSQKIAQNKFMFSIYFFHVFFEVFSNIKGTWIGMSTCFGIRKRWVLAWFRNLLAVLFWASDLTPF